MTPLGLRINNPANIRFVSSNHWQGQVGQYKGFCKFKTFAFGVRALLYLIRKYRYTYGLKSVEQIIKRFAPENENDTESYITFVASRIGCPRDLPLYLDFYSKSPLNQLFYLASAIIKQETGRELEFHEFLDGLKLL